jgi:peptidoglycan/LPS O-acetylase OafA/YrhL
MRLSSGVLYHRAIECQDGRDSSGGGPGPGARIAELDSVRGFAALGVIVFHANPAWLPFGWAAVDLFFVLSGYLITSIIVRNGDSPGFLRNFYVRRGLRTWPIYYLLIAVLIVLSPLLSRTCSWPELPFALTYTQGLPRLWGRAILPFSPYLAHAWSLAIEEQFYLVWPALVLLAGRRRLAVLAMACAGGSALARSRGVWAESLLAQADGLALGGLLAAHRLAAGQPAWHSRGVRLASVTIRFAALAALLFLGMIAVRHGLTPSGSLSAYPGLTVLAFNVLWMGLIDVLLTHAGRPATRLLRLRPFQRVGQISYGLYLYHYPILLITLDLVRSLGFAGKHYEFRLLAILATLPVAALSWRFIEQPLLELKRRHSYAAVPLDSEDLRIDGPASIPPMVSPQAAATWGLDRRVHDSAS